MFGKKPKDGKLGNYSIKHISGLDMPEIICSVNLFADKVLISGGGKEYSLNINRIISVDCGLDVDVKKYSKSSAMAGVVGAAAFGTVGAVIGVAPRSKEDRQVTNHVVIGYTASDGTSEYLIFQSTQPNDQQAAKFVDKLRPLINQQTNKHIEL